MRSISARAAVAVTNLAVLVLASPTAPAAASPPGEVATAAATEPGRLVVSEFAPSIPTWPVNEFVELRNTGDQSVALGGWELVACLSPTTWQVVARFPDGAELRPDGYVLLTQPEYADPFGPSPDCRYTVEVSEDGGWLLVDRWTAYTDGVGLGSGLACTEGDPAPMCDWAAGEAVGRDAQGRDTDDNSADFTCQQRGPGR